MVYPDGLLVKGLSLTTMDLLESRSWQVIPQLWRDAEIISTPIPDVIVRFTILTCRYLLFSLSLSQKSQIRTRNDPCNIYLALNRRFSRRHDSRDP
jgi:hypothetical protein